MPFLILDQRFDDFTFDFFILVNNDKKDDFLKKLFFSQHIFDFKLNKY